MNLKHLQVNPVSVVKRPRDTKYTVITNRTPEYLEIHGGGNECIRLDRRELIDLAKTIIDTLTR